MTATNPYGYNVAHLDGKLRHTAKYLWELSLGPVPEGQVLRRCQNDKACVNPNHCRLTTWEAIGVERRTTHCIHGHEWTEENTHIRKNGKRSCRACDRDRKQRERDEAKNGH